MLNIAYESHARTPHAISENMSMFMFTGSLLFCQGGIIDVSHSHRKTY